MIGIYKLNKCVGQLLTKEGIKIIIIQDFINLNDINKIEIIYTEILTSRIEKLSISELGKSLFVYKSIDAVMDNQIIKSKKFYTDILDSTSAILLYLDKLSVSEDNSLTWIWQDFFILSADSFKFKKTKEGELFFEELIDSCKQKKLGKSVENILENTFQLESDIINELELMNINQKRFLQNNPKIVMVNNIDYDNEQIEYMEFISDSSEIKPDCEINDKYYLKIIDNKDFRTTIRNNEIYTNSFYRINNPLLIKNKLNTSITYLNDIAKIDLYKDFYFSENTKCFNRYEVENLIDKKQECCFLYNFSNSFINNYRNKLQLKMKIFSTAYFVDLDLSLYNKVRIGMTFRGYAVLNLSFINGNPKFTAMALFDHLNSSEKKHLSDIEELSDFEDILKDDELPF